MHQITSHRFSPVADCSSKDRNGNEQGAYEWTVNQNHRRPAPGAQQSGEANGTGLHVKIGRLLGGDLFRSFFEKLAKALFQSEIIGVENGKHANRQQSDEGVGFLTVFGGKR